MKQRIKIRRVSAGLYVVMFAGKSLGTVEKLFTWNATDHKTGEVNSTWSKRRAVEWILNLNGISVV